MNSSLHYAVALGCNTPQRLAREWHCTVDQAKHALWNGVRTGGLKVCMDTAVFVAPAFVYEEIKE